MLRVTGCAVRLHLRVERVGRESTLFLKNFDVAQGAENTLFRRGIHVMSRGIPELELEIEQLKIPSRMAKLAFCIDNVELPF
jgi:hypothetical protein